MTAQARPVPREDATVVAPLSSVRDDDSAPKVIRLKRGPKGKEKRVPLFYIDDEMYSIVAKAKPNDSLKYLDILRKQGQEAAIAFMMETLVSPEGWKALQEYDELTEDDLGAILKAAGKIMTGTMEAPKEPS